MEIDTDALPLGAMFLMHSTQEIQSSLMGLDAMDADVSAKLDGEIDLRLEDGQLVLERDYKVGQLPWYGSVFDRDSSSAVEPDLSQHGVGKGGKISS